MTNNSEDPLLKRQAENREHLNKVLGKHGWKLGAVTLRQSAVIVYNLERLSDGKKIEHPILLSDILMWSLKETPEASGSKSPSVGDFMLWAHILLRVKQENQKDKSSGT